MQEFNFIVSKETSSQAEMRLDAFLGAQVTDISREKIKKAIKNGQCRVDGLLINSASVRVKYGQSVELCLMPPSTHVIPEAGEIEVLWEDEHLLICNKAAGLTVHPCPSCTENTLIQRLAGRYPALLLQEGQRPGIVHRLDKDTSGLMVVALTEAARLALTESFSERRVHKEYLALVEGIIAEHGEISEPLGRHPTAKVKMAIVPENKGGKPAHSAWQRLYADPLGRFSLVKVRIFTGRTHQIRVHMAYLGYPLVGDALYHGNTTFCQRQMLHAWHLCFEHPDHSMKGKACEFYCAPPKDMLDCALNLTQNFEKIIITGLAGCGKSSLLKALEALGLATWSADAVVAKLYNIGGSGHRYFYERFQTRFMEHKNAPLQRDVLRLAMQDDMHLRQEVERVIHAFVREDCARFWEDCQKKGLPYAVAEIPLYLENGWHEREESYIVGISCPQNERYARLHKNRQWSEEQCQSIDGWQWAEQKKMAACDVVIQNDGSLEELESAAQRLVQNIKKRKMEQQETLSQTLTSLWQVPQ